MSMAVMMSFLLVLVVVALGASAASARAEAFGEIAKVGKFGKGPGEFHWPIDLAVDPEEGNSVFVLDSPEGETPFAEAAELRVQKFNSSLAFVAEAMIPVPEEPVRGLKQYVTSIAVIRRCIVSTC